MCPCSIVPLNTYIFGALRRFFGFALKLAKTRQVIQKTSIYFQDRIRFVMLSGLGPLLFPKEEP